MVQSKALEVNIASYYVDVTIDEKYSVLQEVMSKYYGIMEGFNTFLKELSHPYKNWQFIVQKQGSIPSIIFISLKTTPRDLKLQDCLSIFSHRQLIQKSTQKSEMMPQTIFCFLFKKL